MWGVEQPIIFRVLHIRSGTLRWVIGPEEPRGGDSEIRKLPVGSRGLRLSCRRKRHGTPGVSVRNALPSRRVPMHSTALLRWPSGPT
ncbi:hypothetical protein VTJ49DRAFT_6249 [Mycothermus thermophilus]|uniref:Uncharacterized protein n=1 Tax=Humicola insolens TaxID=85995 RepID=A0ABR3V1U4_HUMIN